VTDTPRPRPTGRVFRRSTAAEPPVAVRAEGSTIWDSAGHEYLDAAGGAIVVNVGHGRREIAAARRGYNRNHWDDDRRGHGYRYGQNRSRYWDGRRWRNRY